MVEQRTLRKYLERTIPATFWRGHSRTKFLVEDFEAKEHPNASFDEKDVVDTIFKYYLDRGFELIDSEHFTRFVGSNGKDYGLNLTFIPFGSPTERYHDFRFKVSILDFEKARRGGRE